MQSVFSNHAICCKYYKYPCFTFQFALKDCGCPPRVFLIRFFTLELLSKDSKPEQSSWKTRALGAIPGPIRRPSSLKMLCNCKLFQTFCKSRPFPKDIRYFGDLSFSICCKLPLKRLMVELYVCGLTSSIENPYSVVSE